MHYSNLPIQSYPRKIFAFINQKWLLWLVILFLSFDVTRVNGTYAVHFSKTVCNKTSAVYELVSNTKGVK